jgi:hypothetical protein
LLSSRLSLDTILFTRLFYFHSFLSYAFLFLTNSSRSSCPCLLSHDLSSMHISYLFPLNSLVILSHVLFLCFSSSFFKAHIIRNKNTTKILLVQKGPGTQRIRSSLILVLHHRVHPSLLGSLPFGRPDDQLPADSWPSTDEPLLHAKPEWRPFLRQVSLGAKGGVPSRYTASTSQGNGQSTHQKPARYIAITFRIFQANFIAVFPVQEMPSTFTVSQVM